jgi:uncharacterized protein YjiS (DUF1127 family)
MDDTKTYRLFSKFSGDRLAIPQILKNLLKEKTMFKSPAAGWQSSRESVRRPGPVATILTWAGEAWRRMRAVDALDGLSDRHLKDIGIDRREIGSVVECELARLRRSDLTWHR